MVRWSEVHVSGHLLRHLLMSHQVQNGLVLFVLVLCGRRAPGRTRRSSLIMGQGFSVTVVQHGSLGSWVGWVAEGPRGCGWVT